MSSSKRTTTPPVSPSATKRLKPPSTPFSPPFSSPPRFEWLDRIGSNKSVLHARYGSPTSSNKVACFDFVGTLTEPISQGYYCRSREGWKWLERKKKKRKENSENENCSQSEAIPEVVVKLRELYEEGFNIVVFSSTTLNPDHLEDFKSIVETVCTELDVPIDAFFSTAYDVYRKPCLGMWLEFEKNWNGGEKIDLEESFFVSHAGGSGPLDYGRKFAMNLGIRFYSPREYFFGDERETVWSLKGFNPKKYDHSGPLFLPTSTPLIPRSMSEFDKPIIDIVFLVGPPACGKTSLYYRFFAKAGYERITTTTPSDLVLYLRSPPQPSNSVLDVPLASTSTRSTYLKLFQSHFQKLSSPSSPFKLRCLNFLVQEEVCKHNIQFRELWDRGDSIEGKKRKFVEEEEFAEWRLTFESPKVEEGFDEIKEIRFVFNQDWPTKEKGKERFERWNLFGDCYRKDWTNQK